MKYLFALTIILMTISGFAQSGGPFKLDQTVLAGGGSTNSTGGTYKVEATIGQAAAGARPSGQGRSLQVGFWLAETLAPTAAEVTVSGRIISANGRGIRNVRITITESNGTTRATNSSAFGYYSFDSITAGQSVTIIVSAKRFEFQQSIQVLVVNEALANVDFIANQ